MEIEIGWYWKWLVMEIEESKEVVLLGITIDNLLTFN